MQSAEVERLNGVYNKLLKTAGVDLIGWTAISCLVQYPMQQFPLQTAVLQA